MSAHRVAVTTRVQDLPKAGAGIDILIHHRGVIKGHLAVGRGGVRWTPKHGKVAKAFTWAKLAAILEG